MRTGRLSRRREIALIGFKAGRASFAKILRRFLFERPLRLLDLVDELLILLERDRIRRQDRLISVSLQRVALFLEALVQLCVK